MRNEQIEQNLDQVMDGYGNYKKYPSEVNNFVHKKQISNFVNSLDSDDDLVNISEYFNANKLSQIVKGFGEFALAGGAGYLFDEFFHSNPYGLITAFTLGGIELTRRTCKTMKYMDVEEKINNEYIRQNNSLFFNNI